MLGKLPWHIVCLATILLLLKKFTDKLLFKEKVKFYVSHINALLHADTMRTLSRSDSVKANMNKQFFFLLIYPPCHQKQHGVLQAILDFRALLTYPFKIITQITKKRSTTNFARLILEKLKNINILCKKVQ